MFGKMPIAHDGSPGGSRALANGPELATRPEVGLAMIFVGQLPRFPTGAASAFEKVVARLRSLREPRWSHANRILSLGVRCRVSSNSCGATDMVSWSSPIWATRTIQSNHRQHDTSARRACALQSDDREVSQTRARVLSHLTQPHGARGRSPSFPAQFSSPRPIGGRRSISGPTGPEGRVFVGSEGRKFIITESCDGASLTTARWRSRARITGCCFSIASLPCDLQTLRSSR
jgi:hypothetical protein